MTKYKGFYPLACMVIKGGDLSVLIGGRIRRQYFLSSSFTQWLSYTSVNSSASEEPLCWGAFYSQLKLHPQKFLVVGC